MQNSFLKARLEKLFHAYIISGPKGSEPMKLAMRIAARAVCEKDGTEPCGECRHCKKALTGIHPDIITASRREDKKEYMVEDIRALRVSAWTVPNEAARKVYIIPEAEKLGAQCENVLLKTLEEPPEYAVFILVTENAGALLETVRSRCVVLSLVPEKEAEEDADEDGKRAEEILRAVESKNTYQITDTLLSLEGLSRMEMTELCKAVRKATAARVREGSVLSDEELLAVADAFGEVLRAVELNVSTGHTVGLLLSKLL